MTEKELKKLNRYQLLELLLAQTEQAEQLQAELNATREQLHNRNIQISTLGSIADASLQLSGIFQAAQDAADQYLAAAKKQADAIIADAQDRAKQIKDE